MKFYGYFGSGASYRTRIALNLKGVAYDILPVDLVTGGQKEAAFGGLNPQKMVPVLIDGDTVLTQSVAILEWLEETRPQPPLLPSDPLDRARVRALCALIGSDIQPLNNRRVLEALRHEHGQDAAAVKRWARRWIGDGFDALEVLLAADAERDGFCFGASPTLADCYLVPQVYSAARFGVDLSPWPLIAAVDACCGALPAFAAAHPSRQPDAT
jgi:maleylpyruvate isomerase